MVPTSQKEPKGLSAADTFTMVLRTAKLGVTEHSIDYRSIVLRIARSRNTYMLFSVANLTLASMEIKLCT